MKRCIIFCWVLFAVLGTTAQVKNEKVKSFKNSKKIDEIGSIDDIDKLLDAIDRKKFEVFTVNETLNFEQKECNELGQLVGARPWTKADFDNNGYNDLLIVGNNYGHSIVAILDKGKNNFLVRPLTKSPFQDCTFPVVKFSEGQTIVEYYSLRRFAADYPDFDTFRNSDSTSKRGRMVPLVYKFGGFVELNRTPKTYSIEKIEFRTSGCFGTCPIFEFLIGSDKRAVYRSIQFNRKKKGTYKGKIADREFQELLGLLNYVDFPTLKESYSVGWTDDQTVFLTVTFAGGKTKSITDYGLLGTFGLNRLYEMFFDLRENQIWR